MTEETKLRTACIARLKKLRAAGVQVLWRKVHGSPMQQAGILDLILCCRGRYLEVELKTEGSKATKLQEQTIRDVRRAGGRAGVVRSADELERFLEDERC